MIPERRPLQSAELHRVLKACISTWGGTNLSALPCHSEERALCATRREASTPRRPFGLLAVGCLVAKIATRHAELTIRRQPLIHPALR